MLETILSIENQLLPTVYKLLLVMIPIALPFILLYTFWILRMRWLQMKFINSQKTCLLEIKLPKEISKSPAAMEIFFQYLSQSGAATYADMFLDGKTKAWFSCELASFGGDVHFYVWCSQIKFKVLVESQLYAQYPNIEIHEVEDYTKKVPLDSNKFFIWGMHLKSAKKGKFKDAYPIKTYVDYGLDRDPKDEHKIDPMTALIEFLGSIKPGEQIWIQILVQKHEEEGWKEGRLFTKSDWKDQIKEAIKEEREKTIVEQEIGGEMKTKFANPTRGQLDIINAIERSATKMPFDCMIRMFYISEWPSFNSANIGGLIGCFRQYNFEGLNGFKLGPWTDVSDAMKDFQRFLLPPLKRYMELRVAYLKKRMFHAFKLRSYFQYPYRFDRIKPYVMNTEELATIFHFPSGIVSQTPTLKRVPSKKSEAPSNLPI